MNDITLNLVTMNPLKNPITALRVTASSKAIKNGTPLIASTAEKTPLKDAIVPTERSNSSTFIIRVVPREITASIAICRLIFQKLAEERNAPGFIIPNIMMIRRSENMVPYDCMIDFIFGCVMLIFVFINLPFLIAKM